MKHDIVQAFLIDVRDTGSAIIEKAKLAWMLGRINVNASAFQLLLNEWEQIAQKGHKLHGLEWNNRFTFTARKVDAVEDWVG